jgi:hypothetical protein
MKKTLLTLLAAAGFASFNNDAKAQLALENFNAGVLPANWVLISDGHTVSSTAFNSSTTIINSLNAAAWAPLEVSTGPTDYAMITTSQFTPPASADRWLITPSFNVTSPNTVIQWQDDDLGSGETIDIRISATAGTTAASFGAAVYSAPAGSSEFVTHQVPVGSYNGTNIRVAFHDGTYNNWGLMVDNVESTILPSYSIGVMSINIYPFVGTGSSNPITGVLQNTGYDVISSVHLDYSVNGGAAVSSPLTGLSVPLAGSYTYTSGTNWVPATAGTYTLKVWVDNIDGTNPNASTTNDTVTATVLVVDHLQPKTVLIEEFNQASCDPCAEATPNVDSVYANNINNTAMVRYHVNFPGRDFMDSVTLNPFVQSRLSYYNVSGVPDAQVDGQYVYPGAGYLSSAVIQEAQAAQSPLAVNVTNTIYDLSTNTFSFTTNITSYANLPAGLKAYACLVVDTITYTSNQSTESIPQYSFPQVAENMFPNSGGSTLAAFTNGSTQTLNLSWVKSHPWAADGNVSPWQYDSTKGGTVVVWVEDDNTKYVYQAGSAYIAANPLGVSAVSGNNGAINVYPNPASNTATIALNLKANANVHVEIYNVAGQQVYSIPAQNRNAGNSVSNIDLSNFASGLYIVNVSIGSEVLTKKLTISK